MNGNSSKQVLLSVLGIAILVVAVVGVSFAFFSYTKTGTANNTISTGQIYTYLQTGAQMQLSNAMPVPSGVEGSSIVSSGNSDIGYFTFSVVGKNDSNTPIAYNVYLIPGNNPNELDTDDRLQNSDIGLLVYSAQDTGEANSPVEINAAAKGTHKYILDTIDTTGMPIASGTFAANSAEDTHSYQVNLWVRDTVTISDTDSNARYCAHTGTSNGSEANTGTTAGQSEFTHGCEHNAPVYSTAWYDARVKVVAAAPEGYTIPNNG